MKYPPGSPNVDQLVWDGFLIGLPVFLGGVAASGAAIIYGLAYESFFMPVIPPGGTQISYGQEAALMDVVVGVLGVCVGTSIVLARFWNGVYSAALCLATSLAIAALVELLWMLNVRKYGSDPSDNIVFVPPLFAAGLVAWWSLILAVGTCTSRLLRPRSTP